MSLTILDRWWRRRKWVRFCFGFVFSDFFREYHSTHQGYQNAHTERDEIRNTTYFGYLDKYRPHASIREETDEYQCETIIEFWVMRIFISIVWEAWEICKNSTDEGYPEELECFDGWGCVGLPFWSNDFYFFYDEENQVDGKKSRENNLWLQK